MKESDSIIFYSHEGNTTLLLSSDSRTPTLMGETVYPVEVRIGSFDVVKGPGWPSLGKGRNILLPTGLICHKVVPHSWPNHYVPTPSRTSPWSIVSPGEIPC